MRTRFAGTATLLLSELAAHGGALAAYHVLFVTAVGLCLVGLGLGTADRRRGARGLATGTAIASNAFLAILITVHVAWLGIGRW